MDHIGAMLKPHIDVIDPSFRRYCIVNTHLEKLWTGGRWLEGPVYFGDSQCLLFSDIPNNRILRFDELTASVAVYRSPSRNTNGHTRDQQGRLVSCEHAGRCISRTNHDGSITILAERFEGKRLNSPNDVVVSSDGAIWFTDPTYGIDGDYEGNHATSETGGSFVYRLDPVSGTVHLVADGFVQPNGLAFSADEKTLFVSDTGATHRDNGPRHIRRFSVHQGKLSGGDIFAECDHGIFDGFRLDVHGNIWTSAGDGVHCLNPDGNLIGKIHIPETVANVCFGGEKRNRLYICGTTSLYATFVATNGLPYFFT